MRCAKCGWRICCIRASRSASTSIARRCCGWRSRTAVSRSPTRTTAARSRPARRPTSWCSTGTRSTPNGCAPDLDPRDLLFSRTTMRHIHELIVAGRTVVRDGQVLGIDYPAMRDELLARLRADMAQNAALAAALARTRARGRGALQSQRALLLRAIMPIAKVHRISAAAPDDVSGIEAAIAAGRIDPKGVHRGARQDRGQRPGQRLRARLRGARAEPDVPAPSADGRRRPKSAS